MPLNGSEVLEVLGVDANGIPAAATQTVTTQEIADVALVGGATGTVTLRDVGGVNGSLTFVNGIITAFVAPT